MKVRMGFVSNSSSSSFMMIGAEVKPSIKWMKGVMKGLGEEYDGDEEELEDMFREVLDGIDYVWASGDEDGVGDKDIVGIRYDIDEEEGSNVMSMNDICKDVKKVSKVFGISEDKIKIYTGVRAS